MKDKAMFVLMWLANIVLMFFCIIFTSCFNVRAYNFGIVDDRKIYRCAQPSKRFLRRLIDEHGIKTIAVLKSSISAFEVEMASSEKVRIVHLKMSRHNEPSEETVVRFLEIVKESPNRPVLIHCEAGADRTGLMIAIKRVEIDGWPLKEAKKEMLYYRHIPIFAPMPQRFLEKRYNKTKSNI